MFGYVFVAHIGNFAHQERCGKVFGQCGDTVGELLIVDLASCHHIRCVSGVYK